MIDAALNYIRDELEKYLFRFDELNLVPNKPKVVLGNISQLEAQSSDGNPQNDLDEKVVMTLINVEEEFTLKNGPTFTPAKDGGFRHNPPVNLNLYLLFTITESTYTNAMAFLTKVISFFQARQVFDHENSPGLHDKIEKLLVELYNLNFENLNHLWGVLGGKELPFVLYKIRLVTIIAEPEDSESLVEVIETSENAY
ncbi:MAG: DUF4255 domain-containing protein [Phaeodactylibacter sp.]|nr:DUF4255 domain-containing protein [Phaeodactylibacter sp.]MCB0612464.1 DUF4255 domain-containing protein [Phaeodactylibacter sp.]MCB9304584.1 DUF4255 domain-containing protein [Lewinellaceae bacterium]